MRRGLLVASLVLAALCALDSIGRAVAPEPDVNCAGPRAVELEVVGRLVARRHVGGSRVDRFEILEVLQGRSDADTIEVVTHGFFSPIHRYRLVVTPNVSRGFGDASRGPCGSSAELGFTRPANVGILFEATPLCTWVNLACVTIWVALLSSWVRRRRADPSRRIASAAE